MHKLSIYIAIDSDGDWATGNDADEAISNYNDNIGSCGPLRVVCLNASIRLPAPVSECDVTVPDDAGTIVEATA
jgi:hypothetical protein